MVTPAQMARRRLTMRWTKRMLPAAAVALLLTVAFWRVLDPYGGPMPIPVATPGAAQNRLVAPRYLGVDEQNRPYNVTATVAVQRVENLVELEAPRADMLLNEGTAWVLLEAREGQFDRMRNHLDLAGQVTLWHDNGAMLVTEAAAIDLRANAAAGDRPVAAQGPFGTLAAQGFRLTDRGQIVLFTGRSRLVLESGT